MNKKSLWKIIGGLLGLLTGILSGAYLGLIIGGTFLGGFKIYENTGFEGYELTTYVGALLGAITFTMIGIRLATKLTSENKPNQD